MKTPSAIPILKLLTSTAVAATLALACGDANAQDAEKPLPAESIPVAPGPRITASAPLSEDPPAWVNGMPVPPGYHTKTTRRTGLIIGGAVTFGTAYAPAAMVGVGGLVNKDPAAAVMAIPVLGPLITGGTWLRAKNECSPDSFCIDLSGITRAMGVIAIVDGLIQAAGATMLIAGLSGKTTLVREAPGLSVRPTVFVGETTGVGLAGSF